MSPRPASDPIAGLVAPLHEAMDELAGGLPAAVPYKGFRREWS